MKKSLRILMASILAVVMTFGLMSTAIADPSMDAEETSEAAITKVLKVPFGTALPAVMDFEFEMTPVSYNDSTTDKGMVPEVGTDGFVTISFDGSQGLEGTENGISTYYLESETLFTASMFDQAGIYEYTLIETPDTYTEPVSSAFNERVEYSQAVYTIRVYVDEVNGKLEITHIGAVMIKDDEGNPVDEGDQSKSNPTPGGGEDSEYIYSQLKFTNGYEKTPKGKDPENPNPLDPEDWTLYISKEVTGSFSGGANSFDFSLTLNVATLVVNGSRSCDGYIIEKDGSSYKYVGDGTPITFTSGNPTSFGLAHNQYLVFVEAPIGTGYAVTESRAAGYTPSVTVTYKGISGPALTDSVTGSLNQPLSLPHASINNNLLYVGENGSGADFVNARGSIIPTGISFANLPFFALILLAAGTILALVIIRSRKNKSKNEE